MGETKQKVVLATTNKGKIRELAQELAVHGIEVVGLDQFPEIGEIEEYGQTFAEMGQALKNQISHRARAMEKAIQLL